MIIFHFLWLNTCSCIENIHSAIITVRNCSRRSLLHCGIYFCRRYCSAKYVQKCFPRCQRRLFNFLNFINTINVFRITQSHLKNYNRNKSFTADANFHDCCSNRVNHWKLRIEWIWSTSCSVLANVLSVNPLSHRLVLMLVLDPEGQFECCVKMSAKCYSDIFLWYYYFAVMFCVWYWYSILCDEVLWLLWRWLGGVRDSQFSLRI